MTGDVFSNNNSDDDDDSGDDGEYKIHHREHFIRKNTYFLILLEYRA